MPQSGSRSLPGNVGDARPQGLFGLSLVGGAAVESRGPRLRFSRLGSEIPSLTREQQIRLAVLRVFSDRADERIFESLSPRDWQRLLCWLDLSGLALYFFDRIAKSERADLLPDEVFSALERRLIENAQRTRSMIAESIAIQRGFQASGVNYAIVKGLSLWPNAVSNPELRLQFDLDYLVAEEDLRAAQNVLTGIGYQPRVSSEDCLKFIRNEQRCLTLRNVYKDTGSWAVELRAAPAALEAASPLSRLERRELFGLSTPTLSPVEVFLRQGLHAYKDVCSQFFRLALLVEFYRHVLSYRDNDAFWTALRGEANENPRAALALGVVTLLIAQVIGDFAPEALTHWTVDQLPRPARLWVTTYGRRIVLSSFPGSKLYRLLTSEIGAEETATEGSRGRPPVSPRLGPSAKLDSPREAFSARLMRFIRMIPYRTQLDLMPNRLRFYSVEAARLAWETHRWRRLLAQGSR